MSNELLYTSATSSNKKVLLSGYFSNIATALDSINEIDMSTLWDCTEGKNLGIKLDDLKSKIKTIKDTLNDYDVFLGTVNSEYNKVVGEINDTVATYFDKA